MKLAVLTQVNNRADLTFLVLIWHELLEKENFELKPVLLRLKKLTLSHILLAAEVLGKYIHQTGKLAGWF